MMENNSTSVAAVFEMLLEEIEAEIDFVNQVGARAFEGQDYDKAKEAMEKLGAMGAECDGQEGASAK